MAENDQNDRADIVIENEVATWNLNAEGPVLGSYKGEFKFRCYLTPTQQLAVSRERRDLLGVNAVLATEDDQLLALTLANLKYRVISGPPFWESSTQQNGYVGDIPDLNVLTLILDAALSAEVKFKQEINKRKTQALERAKKAAEKILKTRDGNDGESEENRN